jgi:hypothetical protein
MSKSRVVGFGRRRSRSEAERLELEFEQSGMESGWNDMVRADPGLITRIIIPIEGFTGRYVWHCHILEQEGKRNGAALRSGERERSTVIVSRTQAFFACLLGWLELRY